MSSNLIACISATAEAASCHARNDPSTATNRVQTREFSAQAADRCESLSQISRPNTCGTHIVLSEKNKTGFAHKQYNEAEAML
jgi:hypothetical protein